MQNRGYTKKLDGIALSVTLFLLLSIVYNAIFKDVIKNMLAAALTLWALITLYNALTKPSRHRQTIKKADCEKSRLVFLNFKAAGNSQVSGFFSELLSHAGFRCSQSSGILYAKKDDLNHIVLWDFDTETITANDIYKYARVRSEHGVKAFILMCNGASQCAKTALKQLGLTDSKIYCRTALFNAMKKYDTFPDCPYNFVQKRPVAAEILQYAFSCARFKSYFFLALIMYLFSFITMFKSYYLLSAAALFALAAYSIVNRRFNDSPQSTQDEL